MPDRDHPIGGAMMPAASDGTGSANYSRREAEGIALAAAKEAVTETIQETYKAFGVNMANFDSVENFRRDIEFLRSLRSGARTAGSRFFMALVVILASAFAVGMWEGFKALLHRP